MYTDFPGGVEMLGHNEGPGHLPDGVPWWLHHLVFPPAVHGSCVSSPTLNVVSLFKFGYFSEHVRSPILAFIPISLMRKDAEHLFLGSPDVLR